MLAKRVFPSLIATTGFVLLCTASLIRHSVVPSSNPPVTDLHTVDVTALGQDIPRPILAHDFIGDPRVIADWIARIDQFQRDETGPGPYSVLKEKLYEILGLNRDCCFPLIERILCDNKIPRDLKDRVFLVPTAWSGQQALRFLAGLLVDHKITPESRAGALLVLPSLSDFTRAEFPAADIELARKAMEEGFQSDDPMCRVSVVLILRHFGDPDQLQGRLLHLLRTDPAPEVRGTAANQLDFQGLTNGSESIATEMAAHVLEPHGLIDRYSALNVLLATGTDLARKVAKVCLDDEDSELRRRALFAVSRFQMTEELPRLSRWMIGEEKADETTRLYCVLTLGKMPDPASVRLLFQGYLLEDDPSIKERYTEVLLKNEGLKHGVLVDEVTDLYRRRQADPPLSENLLEILGASDTDQSYAALVSFYSSGISEERERIASILLGHDHAPLFAAEYFQDLVGTSVGGYAIQSLAKVNPDRVLREIAQRYSADGMQEETRSAAIRTLAEIGGAPALAVLKSLGTRETNEDLRRTIREQLDRLDDGDF